MSKATHADWRDDTLILQVYIQTRASCDELVGRHERGLKIRLKAPPVDGQANRQLMKFLAKLFKVPVSRVSLLKGETSRQKTLAIQNPGFLPELLTTIDL